ncbi:MAG TPA: hypothetical protein VGD60_02160 [Candidatus Acidoferrales bacterium]
MRDYQAGKTFDVRSYRIMLRQFDDERLTQELDSVAWLSNQLVGPLHNPNNVTQLAECRAERARRRKVDH